MADTDFGFRPDKAITEQERKRKQTQREAREQAVGHAQRADKKADKAIQRLEGGKGNPVEIVLYERQQAILENQRAIMAALGIDAP